MAALFDLGVLLALTAAVTTIVALSLGVPMPGLREVGPDLLVAGILDRNPHVITSEAFRRGSRASCSLVISLHPGFSKRRSAELQ